MVFNHQSGLRIPSTLNPAQRQCPVEYAVHCVLSVGRSLFSCLLCLKCVPLCDCLTGCPCHPPLLDNFISQILTFSFLKILCYYWEGHVSVTANVQGSQDSAQDWFSSPTLSWVLRNQTVVISFSFLLFLFDCLWHQEHQKCSVNIFNETWSRIKRPHDLFFLIGL